MLRSLVSSLVLLVAVPTFGANPLPVEVSPKDPGVRFVGRWDTRDQAGPRADWSASEVGVRFSGMGLNVKVKGNEKNAFQIVVDGKPAGTLQMTKGETVYEVAKDLPAGEHTVQLVKRTEGFFGAVQCVGFQIAEGGKALEWTAKPTHRIEIIGDSISAGYGNEAAGKEEHFKAETENGFMTYGVLAARAFGAECHVIAWSGRKMFPDKTMPSIYEQTLATDGKLKWDFSKWTADVVVINLSTNDFHNKPTLEDEKGWIAAYEAFISGTIRKKYPQADVFICTSPMLSGEAAKNLKAHLATIQSDLAAAGEKKVHVLMIPTQNSKDGYGADWHPSVKTQEKTAEVLSKALEETLGWKRAGATKAP